MKCLVSPTEAVFNPNTGDQIGWRVAEVRQEEFVVGDPMFWFNCDDNVLPDIFYFDTGVRQIKPTPQLEQPVQTGADNL